MDLGCINRPREKPLNCDELELRVEKGNLEMLALLTSQTQLKEQRTLCHFTQYVFGTASPPF